MLDSIVRSEMEAGRLLGLQAFVARAGEVLVDRAYGTRPQDGGELRPEHRMAVFSASKAVTGVALHLLVERGLIAYGDSLARHVEEFAQLNKGAITFHLALTHQAGIPDFYMRFVPPEAFGDWGGAISGICSLPLEYWPGTQTAYHPLTVWAVMAEAISRRDGRPFDRFCREEIFEPLQMTRTSWGLPESLEDEASDLEGLGDAADLCGRWNSRAVRAAVIPGGGLFTCARDLGRFYAALGRELLTPATLRHVTTQQGEPGGSGWGYGFTVGVEAARVDSRGNLGSPRQFGHSGFCVAQAWRDPETDTVAVFILNRGLGQAEGDRILNLLSDAVHRAVSR